MELKNHTVSFVFFVGMLCVYFFVDSVNAYIVTTEKVLNQKPYSRDLSKETIMSTTIQDRYIRRRRSIMEQDDTGKEDICADIIGPKWQMNKQGKSSCQKLDVWVLKKTGFTEFAKIEQSKVVGGFSIAIFCYALQLLPFKVQPVFNIYNGTYDQLVKDIENKTCQSVAGDVTIRDHRAQYVDFTIPYLRSEVYMLVQGVHEWNQTLWTFLRPFSRRLWMTIVGMCIYIGVAVAILEYRVGNPEFRGPYFQKVIMVFSFPISTFFFNEGKILNRNSKVVLVMWLSTIFIIVQVFTATLSSWLTLNQLRPRLPSSYEKVGYHDRSFVKEFIMKKYNYSAENLLPLKSVEEYKDALSNGSVSAVFDELPYVELFLAKYGSDYMKFGPINQESGIAFAFSRGSNLLSNFSRAVINITESDIMMEMKKQYFGFRTPDVSQPNQALPQNIDVQSFIGLFIFMGIVTIAAIISSEISLRRENKKIIPISTDE